MVTGLSALLVSSAGELLGRRGLRGRCRGRSGGCSSLGGGMLLVLLDPGGAGRLGAVVRSSGRSRGSLSCHCGANDEGEAGEGRNNGFHDVFILFFFSGSHSVCFHYERRSSSLTGDEAAIKVSTDLLGG